MEGTDDQEEFLSLRLAIVTDCDCVRKRKRKRRDAFKPSNTKEGCEGTILSLLEFREQMLKLDNKRKEVFEDGKGLHLIHLLLMSATSIHENNNMNSALENLCELYQSVSLYGDSVQRVAAYFADGLVARLLTRKSPFYEMIMKGTTPKEEFLAFTDLYQVSPYYQFAHFTANQAIIEAFEKEEDSNDLALSVIDFDVSYGFQWPCLIQSLSEKGTSGQRVSLTITGFGNSLKELQETETRLVSFAKGFCNLVFEFQGLLKGSKITNLGKKKNETLVVNFAFHLTTLNNFSKISETLNYVHSLEPSIVIVVEQEGSRSPRSFLSRFMELLQYFAAMFDSLDDCLPLESAERLRIEKNHLGKEIKSLLNYDEDDVMNFPKYERMGTWKGRMEGHGFAGLKLSSRSMIQAKLILKIRSHCFPIQVDGENGGFRIFERDEGRAISLGWQDKCLITASTWQCV